MKVPVPIFNLMVKFCDVPQRRVCIQPGQPQPPDCSLLFPGPAHTRHRKKVAEPSYLGRSVLEQKDTVCCHCKLQVSSCHPWPSFWAGKGESGKGNSITRVSAQLSLSSSQAGSVAYVGCVLCQHSPLQNCPCRLLGFLT